MRRGSAVVVFSLSGLFASSAAAQTFRVPADGTLQQGIDGIADGGLIEISAGTYAPPSANGFQIVNKNKSFTIRGVGSVVLSGGGSSRVLRLANGRPIVFENLTFANGYSDVDGFAAGVTLHGAKATFVGCAFTGNNNNAPFNGGGGSMVESGSSAIFLRSSWSGNRAKNFGAAMSIGNASSAFIHDSEFLANRTNFPGHAPNAAGGAIYMYNSALRITNTRFLNNEAGYVAGAVYAIGTWTDPTNVPAALVTIANSSFEGNQAKRAVPLASPPTEAGAIHCENQCTTRIHNSRFVGNLADVGGAVNSYRGELEVYSSVFKGNTNPGVAGTSTWGGAINTLSNDTPADGFINRRSARLVVHDSFLQGRVSGQTTFPGSGGCINVNGDQNRQYGTGVPQMGGVAENRAPAEVRRSVFYDCDLAGTGAFGGGISAILGALTLADSIVMWSSGSTWGGGLAALVESGVTVTNSTFSDNAAGSGGGLFIQGSTLNLSGSRLVRNSATSSGAAIHSEPDSLRPVFGSVTGNTISDNPGTMAIGESDQNNGTRYNAVQYDANAIQGSTNAYYNPISGGAGFKTAAQLNSLSIPHSGGPTIDKSPSGNNTAPGSAPVVGQIVAVPPALLTRGARNETGPFPSYVGYTWGGAATATVNGVSKSAAGFVTVTSPGQQSLQVSSSSFTDVVASATMPALGFFATPGTVRPGDSSTLSWGASAGSVFEVGMDQGIGASPFPSGGVVVTPPATTTYRAVAVTAEGGADAAATVVVGIPPLTVAPATVPGGTVGVAYSQTFTQTGGTPPITWSLSPTGPGSLPPGITFNPSTAVLSGTPSQAGSFWITVTATDSFGTTGSVSGALAIVRVAPFTPAALSVDSGGNSVLETGETVAVAPSWRNQTGGALAVTGAASAFTGAGDPVPPYSITDAAASYGSVANGATASCSGNCYQLALGGAPARPAQHWDARVLETLSSGDAKHWLLHVGDSFGDVPRTNPYYRFVETLYHRQVTGGCGLTSYCPDSATTRDQMAVFVLVAKEGGGYVPQACGTPLFGDVPASNGYCRWIEELARRGVVGGCGAGNYCPSSPVSRDQMAVFALRTLDPAVSPPACGTPVFADVPASSGYCRWIEELARRGVVSGCGGGNYCPTSPVTRGQMGVFLSVTFGLTLYGP